jgi:general stress protein 26
MPTPQELEKKFWKALKADRTMMLGLYGVEEGHTRPMTGLLDSEGWGDRTPIWFFTARDTELAQALSGHNCAVATFASKGHDLFATLHGDVSLSDDRAVIDRLWNPYIAAWFPGGKEDPKLTLIRFDADRAEIWLDDSSFLAGVKLLLGVDPKLEYKDNVAEVTL